VQRWLCCLWLGGTWALLTGCPPVMTTTDSGQPPIVISLNPDAGVAFVDAGDDGRDGGTAPADSGMAPVDAGGQNDAGDPVAADAGTAMEGGDDAGAVVDGGGLPVDLCAGGCAGQHDVMLQAFYWDPPVDAAGRDGFWWDHLGGQVPWLRSVGVTGLWVPSPAKGNFGIYDMGYGIYDLFDLGNYEQKGTVETRFGSRAELEAFLAAAHARDIEVYADIVLNHVYTSDDDLEPNPAVTAYVHNGAEVGGVPYEVYPTDELQWSIPTTPGAEVEIDVGGYRLPWTAFDGERAFRIDLLRGGTAMAGLGPGPHWHDDTDGGVSDIPEQGIHAIIETEDDSDTFRAVADGDALVVGLRSRRIGDDGPEGNTPQHGYRVVGARVDGAPVDAIALTRTRVAAVEHTGPGELPVDWSWEHFHPSSAQDFLEGPGDDEVRPRWRVFGQDIDTFHPDIAATYQGWGAWLMDTVGFDGVRLDWVVGVQEPYVADFLAALGPDAEGAPRFAVGEYFAGNKARIRDWVTTVDPQGSAALKAFDFPLKFTLTRLTNDDGATFDARTLATAGLVRDPAIAMASDQVVTFVENHDTGKEAQYWMVRDMALAHAFVLFAPERPCLFYKHLYAVDLVAQHDASVTVAVPGSLPQAIALMAAVRAHHLGGPMVSLSDVGAPFPAADAADVYIARRPGPEGLSGAILVINDHETETKGIWVDTGAGGLPSLVGEVLVDITGRIADESTVFADGRAFFSAPPRSFTVWMPAAEWQPARVPTFTGEGLAP
jgi:alpha-amylase